MNERGPGRSWHAEVRGGVKVQLSVKAEWEKKLQDMTKNRVIWR